MYWDKEGVGYFFPPPPPNSPDDNSMWRQFRQYDKEHPEIWEQFKQYTKQAWDSGFRKIGAHFIVHKIRWEGMSKGPRDPFKVNHNFFPYYARKFMDENPEYTGMFDLRRLTKVG